MKKTNPAVLFSGVLFVIFTILSGCGISSNELAFEQDRKVYVIDPESAMVSVFTAEGKFTQKIGAPAAGTVQQEIKLPPEILLFLLKAKGSISGLVWNDLNGNQVFDSGEQGVQEVRVFIDTNDNTIYDQTDSAGNTDITGYYTITGVKPGTKKIYVDVSTITSGYGFTTPQPYQVDLARNQIITDIDFGIQDQSGFINGTIWDQTDSIPIPGVEVYADLNNDDVYTLGEPSGTTDASGAYIISGLAGGTYAIHVNNGTLNVQYHRTPVSGSNPTTVTLVPGGSMVLDFTYVHKATISGVVLDADGNAWGYITLFIDLNGNGVYDAGEPITVADALGNYIFDELFPGTYTILILPDSFTDGYTIIPPPGPITIAAGDNFIGADFLTQAQPVTITGYVWDDANGNALREGGEVGINNLTVYLDANRNGIPDGTETVTITDSSGAFTFNGLEQGFYYIRTDDSSLLQAYIPTTPFNPVYHVIGPGQTYTGAEFGYQSKLAPVHSLLNPTKLSWGSDGSLYVSDSKTNTVFIYDSGLTLLGELKGLDQPLGIATDAGGNIYVGNQGRRNVEAYDASGNLITSIGDGNIMTPNDIALDRDNNLYILDSFNDVVLIYNQSGNLINSIGDSLLFDYPVSIAINYRDEGGTEVGELYVADTPNCTIHVFALDSTYKKSVGSCGSLYTTNWDGKFSGLLAVDIDQYGNIHGLDNNLNVVQVFEPQNGTFVTSYNAYTAANELMLNLQTDISIHPVDNRVLMTNVATRSVETITVVPAP